MTERYGTAEDRYKYLSAIYDELFPFDADGSATVAALERLAPAGRMLELGVGTGRVALALARQGCEVTGIDSSPDMLRVLESNNGDGAVHAVLGDMAHPSGLGEFDVIYLVYNTLFELHTQDLQVACVSSAARNLRGGGRLVIEAAVPSRVPASESPVIPAPFKDLESVGLQIARYDHVQQIAEYRHVFLGPDGVKIMPSVHRYVYVSELDLMATLAGLKLEARHSDWDGSRFDARSSRHVSVYVKP
jgi:SAM-dependent methyltransferase